MENTRKAIENKITGKVGRKKLMVFDNGVELRDFEVTFWPAYDRRGRKPNVSK